MKKQLLSVMVLLCTMMFGQELPTIIPPSPEATSLGKYVEAPVSYYNGLPSIGVPLYKVALDGLSIPVSLSYHAKGIRVEEMASRVGLGWSLNAGGVITRQIRGNADEYTANGVTGYLRDNFYQTFFTSEDTRRRVYSKTLRNEQDLIPDSFMFNFLGYSGKFIFDQRTRQPIIQSFSDVTIIPIWESGAVGAIKGWKVHTPDGYTFHFGTSPIDNRTAIDKEHVVSQGVYNGTLSSSPGSGFSPNSAWYLLDIISPQGRSVRFTYQTEEPTYVRRSYDKYDPGTSSVSCLFSRVRPLQHQVKEIVFEQGTVEFIASTTAREDLTGAYPLDKIKVKNSFGNIIKSYKFNYFYTNSVSNTNALPTLLTLDPKASKRLFLESITTFDNNEVNTLPPHRFEYHPQILPSRFSNSQDTWGYYNGKDNGPFLTFFQYNNRTIDRTIDPFKCQAGLLTKVIYPTAGTAIYEYEANRVVPPNYFSELLTPDTNPTETKTISIVKNPDFYTGSIYQSETFTISEEIIGQISADVNISPADQCSSTAQTTTCPYKVTLYNANNSFVFLNGKETYTIPPGDYKLKATPKNSSAENPLDWESSYFSVFLQWEEQITGTPNEPNLLFTSGNRIKRITLQDDNNGTLVKEYAYKKPDGTSSGLLFSPPSYYYKDKVVNGAVVITRKHGARPGSPLTYEQGNHEGYSHVTEYQVGNSENLGKTEYSFTAFEDTGDFYRFPYHPATDNEWLRGKPLETNYYAKTGTGYTPVRSIVNQYNYGNDGTAPLSLMFPFPPNSISNEVYINNPSKHIQSQIIFADQDGTPGDPDEHNEFKTYYFSGGTCDLLSTTTTDYFGTSSTSQKTSYAYDYNKDYQLRQTVMTTSKGKTTTTKTYYPQDVTSAGALGHDDLTHTELRAIQTLQKPTPSNPDAVHRVSEPVQVEAVVKNASGAIIAQTTQRTLYKDWDNGIVLPEFVQTLKGEQHAGNTLENRIEYLSYDTKGNPLEVKKSDGSHIIYIWGYHDQYPIARIDNATYTGMPSDVVNLIHQIRTDSNIENTAAAENTMRSKCATLRDKPFFTASQITFYTYDPLIGTTSVTDPKGYTIYYQYDDFNRLTYTRDAEGNLVSRNKYNYKNQ